MLDFFRRALDLTHPEGPAWDLNEEGDWAKLRDGDSDNLTAIREDVINLKYIRTPSKTPVLSDLEREYGINPNSTLTEAERIARLEAEVYKKATTANKDDLQTLLDRAGFNLTVYQNSPNGPAVDPAIFLNQNFQMVAGGFNGYAGRSDAYAGLIGGELLVNGDIFEQSPAYLGAGTMWAGNDTAHAGYFSSLNRTLIQYDIPTDPDNWPFVFFVGGATTFNPDGSLATIEQGFAPQQQEKALKDIILKFKPLFTWCGLIVTFE